MAANPTFSNRTYAGEFFAEMFGPTVLDPAGLEDNQLATVIDRFKFKQTIYENDDTVVFQTPGPLFNDQNTQSDTGEVNLTLVPYKFNKTISLDELRETWYSSSLALGSLNDYSYDQLVDFYVGEVYAKKLKQGQDNLVIKGKKGLDSRIGSYTFTAPYTGLYDLFNASSSIRKISIAGDQIQVSAVAGGTTTTLTVASDVRDSLQIGNLISIRGASGTGWTAINGDWEVQDLTETTVIINVDTSALTNGDYTANSAKIRYINANNIIRKLSTHLRSLPVQVRRNQAKIVIAEHLYLEWQLAVGEAQQNGGSYVLKPSDMQLIEQRIVVLDNAPANTIGSWLPKHVFYGYDLSDDYSTVQVLWQGQNGDDVYKLKGAMKTGIAITQKFQNEITLSTPDA